MSSADCYENEASRLQIEEIFENFINEFNESKYNLEILQDNKNCISAKKIKTNENKIETEKEILRIYHPSKNDLDNLEKLLDKFTETEEYKILVDQKYSIAEKFIKNNKLEFIQEM